MDGLIYILDTNVITDRMKVIEPVASRFTKAVAAGHEVYLCQPVYYEVLRGLLKVNATSQLQFFQTVIVPFLKPLALIDSDWQQAAQFWADARNIGKQLSDGDLLIAALAYRLNAILVSNDADFDALPIQRENWRVVSTTDES